MTPLPETGTRKRRILAISSQVAHGHVGLSAILPVLQRLGYDVTAIPTILLSNHPGFAHCAGAHVDVALLESMVDTIAANGWLATFDAVLTGYLPTAGHVSFARRTIARLREAAPSILVICDPILGDDPKGLYIDHAAACAIRDELLPRAHLALPNRFELSWLASSQVESVTDAVTAARTLPVPVTVATSIPAGDGRHANVYAETDTALVAFFDRLDDVTNGTGDAFSALMAARWPMERATGALGAMASASRRREHLLILDPDAEWPSASAVPVDKAAL